MKNLRLFAFAAAIALFSCTFSDILAQSKDKNNWEERFMSEKIAFITVELELTPEEAQVFWPVYNQISKQKKEAHWAVAESYNALKQALDEGKKSDKEIDKLLDAYLESKQALKTTGENEADKFRKVLPSKKVAKLYVAEEKFRRSQIRNMKNGHHHGGR
jgi:Spy/CpxP family protein refolding chaperone